MTTLLAVDPGVTYCGCAVFQNGILFAQYTPKIPKDAPEVDRAFLLKEAIFHTELSLPGVPKVPIDVLVVEGMKIYPPRVQKVPPADILAVQTVVGALLSMPCGKRLSPVAAEWKGQLVKKVHHARIEGKLSATEKLAAHGASEHAWDAIGLGLWALKR